MEEIQKTKTEQQYNELFTALSKFQGDVKAAIKSKTGYGYKYADIASVFEAAQEPLAKYGLCVSHTTYTVWNEGHPTVMLKTILGHESGQSLVSDYPLLPVKNDPQGMGSALTYARRYCFMAITGLPVADDDAASASGKPAAAEKSAEENGVNLYREANRFLAENATKANKFLRKHKWIKPKETWADLETDQRRQIADGLDSFRDKVLNPEVKA
jgi:hypothetical protein